MAPERDMRTAALLLPSRMTLSAASRENEVGSANGDAQECSVMATWHGRHQTAYAQVVDMVVSSYVPEVAGAHISDSLASFRNQGLHGRLGAF